MTSKNLKDQRRADLIIPYAPTEAKAEEADFAATLASTLPMAALFTRNKMIAWTSLIFGIQSWLNETPGQLNVGKQPAIFSVLMGAMSVLVTYMPMFLPSRGPKTGTGTEVPPPATS